ncbi:ABC transporter substrate-binding protein [Acidipropionibacterium virtanenii]|uniref:Putative siderophore-binding lipoprotein YfiY n=1 Tax=Acidipropionibacterium virtanenii TaxID=2057246 RepID=A0A344URM5_9ACTN|nr:ABC transporter substrate-binding protein [Acidipropionibacterium virtanenii]AXE37923.1 putative siderophore-binding lipoprotein YfiY [Acidipropionibacterium virtanenii]
MTDTPRFLTRAVSRRGIFSAAAGTAAVLGLSACGAGSSSSGASSSGSSVAGSSAPKATDSFPVSIKHAWGTTTIDSAPSRVATSGWSGEDAVLALGVMPVGMPKANYGVVDKNGMLAWTAKAAAALGGTLPKTYDETDSLDTEAIADTEPDLILGISSGITKQQYTTLSEIAPTVPYTSKIAWGATWRDVMRDTAKAMGRSADGTKVIADCEKKMAAAVAAHKGLKGRTAAVMYFDPKKLSTIGIYTAGDARPQYLADLGLPIADSVTRQSKGTTSFYRDISAENADVFSDVDIIVCYGDPKTLLPTLQKDPLLSKITAVKRGSVAVIQDNSELASAVSPSVLSIPDQVGAYTKALAEAAAKIG